MLGCMGKAELHMAPCQVGLSNQHLIYWGMSVGACTLQGNLILAQERMLMQALLHSWQELPHYLH
jgi:hypothetical protein